MENTFEGCTITARGILTREFLRFLGRDPRGFSSGSYSSLFSYVNNSPMNGADPTGMLTFGPFGNVPPSSAWAGMPAAVEVAAFHGGASGATGGSGNGNGGGPQTATGSTSGGSAARTQAVEQSQEVSIAVKVSEALAKWGGGAIPDSEIPEMAAEIMSQGGNSSARDIAHVVVSGESGFLSGGIVGGADVFGNEVPAGILATSEAGGEVGEAGGGLGIAAGVVVGIAVGAAIDYVTAPAAPTASPAP